MTAPKLVPTVRNYEDLDGGQGREVFFRPHRYRKQDLLPLRAVVGVRLGSDEQECMLHDVSQNGVAFELPAGCDVDIGTELEEIEVRFDEYVAYRGEAKVGSVRRQDGVAIVGVSFSDLLLDIEEALHMREVRSWKSSEGTGLQRTTKTWHVEGYDRFKSLVADFGLFLRDAERQLSELEGTLAWHVVHGDNSAAARKALITRIDSEFAKDVIYYTEIVDAAARSVPRHQLKALKEYSLRHLQESFMKAPWMHRARHKPFGYPGDYEIMRFFYERNFEGSTLFAKAMHYASIQCKAAQAVVQRKNLIKRQLRGLLEARRSNERPFRILSVAAGPAQELFDLLTETEQLNGPLEIVLFDQDKGALSYAYRRLKPLTESRWPGGVKLLYLHESIKRLVQDSCIFVDFGQFDAIFSCGLFDYLSPTTAVILTRNLFARLARGGILYSGNMVPENPCRWVMELHLDWNLVHRTRAELAEIGQRAVPGCRMRILEEETGVNPFIEMTNE